MIGKQIAFVLGVISTDWSS